MVEARQENQQPDYDDGNGAVRVLWTIRTCHQSWPNNTFFELTTQNTDLMSHLPTSTRIFLMRNGKNPLTGLKCTDLKKAHQCGTTSSGGCRIALLSSLHGEEPTSQEVLPLSINIKCFTPPAGGSLTQQRTTGLYHLERRGWLNISTFSTGRGTWWDVFVSVFNETSHQIISLLGYFQTFFCRMKGYIFI